MDYIALRFDSEKRSVYLKYLENAEGQGSPLYARSSSLFDLFLAKITVPANAQYLTDEMVENLRGTSDCPWINLRFDLDAITSSFQAWYDNVRQLLDEDVAVQLQEQIDENADNITTLNSTIANLVVQNQQLQEQLENERKYDNVIKNDTIYLYTRPYDPTIDTDIP